MTSKNIALAVLGVAVLGAGLWWSLGNSGSESGSRTEDAQNMETADTMHEGVDSTAKTGTGTFTELAKAGEALECHFSFSDTDVTGEGTGFFANGKARVDSEVQQGGSTYMANYIIRDDHMYMWSSSPQGEFAIQMSVDETQGEFAENTETPVGPNENVDYECRSWSVDGSAFALPEGVEFMNMNEMMQGFQGMNQAEMEAMMQISQ